MSWLNLGAVALFGTVIAHTIFNVSLKVIRAEKASTITVLSAPEAYIFGILFFGEYLSLWSVLGLVVG